MFDFDVLYGSLINMGITEVCNHHTTRTNCFRANKLQLSKQLGNKTNDDKLNCIHYN